MPSLTSRAMPTVLRLRGSKKLFSSPEAVREQVRARSPRPPGYAPPAGLERTVDLSVRQVAGWPVYEATPRGGNARRRETHLHGGAYINDIAPQHWQLIAHVAAETATRITVLIYPLAPPATAAEVAPAVTDLAVELLDDVGDTPPVSSGTLPAAVRHSPSPSICGTEGCPRSPAPSSSPRGWTSA